jgi:hypothetical protein
MSVNKALPHVFVLPEDDANRQLANGFQRDDALDTRRMQVLGVAGGWQKVVSCFNDEHVSQMDRYDKRFMVLLIDFDEQEGRLNYVLEQIPERLKERVFILGTWSKPERLRPSLGSYEMIGSAMAKDCREGTDTTWANALLRHNACELERLRENVRPFLFK